MKPYLTLKSTSLFVMSLVVSVELATSTPSAALTTPLTFVYNWVSSHCPSYAKFNPSCVPDILYNCDADVADAPVRAWHNSTSVNMLASVDLGSRGFSGRDLDSVSHTCHVYARSTNESTIDMYADREWVHSPFYFKQNNTLVSLTHMEDHDPVTMIGRIVAVTLFVSDDGGGSWHPSAPPPRHIVAVSPYQWNSSMPSFGFRSPSSILEGRGAQAGFYFATVTANWGSQFGLQASSLSKTCTQLYHFDSLY